MSALLRQAPASASAFATHAGTQPTRILVLGLGNSLLTDDGFGPRLLERLRLCAGHDADRIEWIDGGTVGLALLTWLEGISHLLVLDAAQIDGPAGTVRILQGVELDTFLLGGVRTAHDVGLRDLFDGARLLGRLPSARALVAVRPQSVDWGDELSATVERAVPEALSQALRVLAEWSAVPAAPRHATGRTADA